MRSGDRWLIRDVTVGGARVDCRLRGGSIAEIGPALASHDESVLDAAGGALLPGLADHHIHLLALAAARGSLDLRGADTLEETPESPGRGWLRVIGGGAPFTRADLDRRWPDRPVRVQHRGGRLWTLNSEAIATLVEPLTTREAASGQLWDADARLRGLLGGAGLPSCAAVAAELAGCGITHLTDATPDLSPSALRIVRREVCQRLVSMSGGGDGPRKLVISDVAPPDLAQLRRDVEDAHRSGRAVAIHVVTAWSLALALAALDDIGTLPGDRLEHAAVCDDAAATRIAELGVTVVTQPTIFERHRDRFLSDGPPEDRKWLWRLGGLIARGVRVAVSSDAPYGDPDPAATLRACVSRPAEWVPARAGLQMMLSEPADPAGPARRVAPGAAADLCLLAVGVEAALAGVAAGRPLPVRATFIAGRQIFER